jgi:predicted dithiol-disulfide oxidoreductase (DUF899 family)
MKTPPIVLPEKWEAAREELLVKQKELTHARNALAAKRRRMPWAAARTRSSATATACFGRTSSTLEATRH